MTSPTPQTPQQPKYADRAFRSPMGVVGGVLLLAFGIWLVTDAIAYGAGHAPLLALAWLLLAAPLVIAFTLRPVVYVSDARMLVRNPLRTITIPWARVETVHAKYSTEVVTDDATYQLWSVPVSMRARKRADRHSFRASSPSASGGLFGRRASSDPFAATRPAAPRSEEPVLASSDQAVKDLRELAERNAGNPGADAPVTIRWAYAVIAPAALGAIAVIILLAI